MENNKNQLIPVNNSLVSIERQIFIGDKIINQKIEELFNKAFKLINSKNIDISSENNFLYDFLFNEDCLMNEKYTFKAKTKDDYLIALDLLDEIIKLDKYYKLAYYFKGIISKKIFLIDESIAYFSKAIEIDKKFIVALIERIALLNDSYKFDLAFNDCNHIISLKPDCAEFYHERANVMFSLGKKNESINDYKVSLELDDTNIRAYNNLGRTYKSLNYFELAKENFNKAISLAEENLAFDNKNAKSNFYIGYAKWQLEKYTASLESLNEAIHINPEYTSALQIRAIVNKELRNYKDSINDYKKYLKLNPLCFNSYNSLGFLYYDKTKEYNKANKCFTKSIDLKFNPKLKNSYYFRSKVRKELGDVNGSNEDYKIYQYYEKIKKTSSNL